MEQRELRVSQRELHRIHVVRLTLEGRESVGKSAKLLGISPRQMKRLRRKVKELGIEGLLHGNRGKKPWNKMASEQIEKVIRLARGKYQGLNDTHLSEKLKKERWSGYPSWRSLRRGIHREDCSIKSKGESCCCSVPESTHHCILLRHFAC